MGPNIPLSLFLRQSVAGDFVNTTASNTRRERKSIAHSSLNTQENHHHNEQTRAGNLCYAVQIVAFSLTTFYRDVEKKDVEILAAQQYV